MARWREFTVLVLICAGFAPRLPAAEDPCLNRKVSVNVLTNKNQLVIGLTPENFRGTYRGKAVQVASASYEIGPRRAVILLDTSASMQDKVDWELAILNDLVSSARPQVSFAFLTFGDKIQDTINFRPSRPAFVADLRKIEPNIPKEAQGKTAALDALADALTLLGKPRAGDAIILISDGGDNHSKTETGEIRKEMLRSASDSSALSCSGRPPPACVLLKKHIGRECFFN